MKIDTKIKYEESYLPTKRHRIPRIREMEEGVTVELREIRKEAAPVALIVKNYQSYVDEQGANQFALRDTPYLAFEGRLFSEKRDMRGALDQGAYPLDQFLEDAVRVGNCTFCWGGKGKDDMLAALNAFVDAHILIDGVIYTERAEPRYVVNTFGLGHNHGGTAMFIDRHYNPNISKDNYFNALQREEAIAYANKVAEARGDTESIGRFDKINIEVYMPEMIRCNPQAEHGDGDPFMNGLESLVRASTSASEAGVLVMAAAAAEAAKQ